MDDTVVFVCSWRTHPDAQQSYSRDFDSGLSDPSMGILVTLSLSKKKAPIGRKKYFVDKVVSEYP